MDDSLFEQCGILPGLDFDFLLRSDTLQTQLEKTSNELRELKVRQHKLEERNLLLEKVAQINSVQQSEQSLMWEVSEPDGGISYK